MTIKDTIIRTKAALLGVVVGLSAVTAEAALYGRLDDGYGNYYAYYDDLLNVTWLADANLAETQAFGVAGIGVGGESGRMDFGTSNDWLAAMNSYGGTGYLGIDDWRAPTMAPINGVAFNTAFSNDGSTDVGFNIGAPGTFYAGSTASEMAHMFYISLGNLASTDTDGNPQPGGGLDNPGPFSNFEPHRYLSGTESGSNRMWVYEMASGRQTRARQVPKGTLDTGYVWAVRSGDVPMLLDPTIAAVPVPAAVWLFGSGLFALAGVARKKSHRR